jgi:ribosomal 30S subunit maturation factor RimM
MTGSSHQQSTPQALIQDIDQFLEEGMSVVDLNGDNVGAVEMYSTAAGYLMVGYGGLEHKALYIPFRLIRSIDPNRIALAATRDALAEQYTQPPAIKTVVENRLVPGPHGAMTQQAQEVQLVESGYDGMPVALDHVDVGSVANRLSVGMAVYDATGVRLGDITQYDTGRSLLVVEKGIFKPTVLFVPFSAITTVDRDTLSVHLSLPRDAIIKEHAMLPEETP